MTKTRDWTPGPGWSDVRREDVEYIYRVNMPTPDSGPALIKRRALEFLSAIDFTPFRDWNVEWKHGREIPERAILKDRIRHFMPNVRVTLYNRTKSPEDYIPTLVVHGLKDADIFVEDFFSRKKEEFCIAHEIGHYLLHTKMGKVHGIFPRLSSGAHDREATLFAGVVCLGIECVEEMLAATRNSVLGTAKLISDKFQDCRYLPPLQKQKKKKRKKRSKFKKSFIRTTKFADESPDPLPE